MAEMNPKPSKPRRLKKKQDSTTDLVGVRSFICPITGRLMRDPVITIDDGHSYERSAVEAWFAKGNFKSPMTGAELRDTTLVPNHSLRSAIEEFVASLSAPTSGDGGNAGNLRAPGPDGLKPRSRKEAAKDAANAAQAAAAASEATDVAAMDRRHLALIEEEFGRDEPMPTADLADMGAAAQATAAAASGSGAGVATTETAASFSQGQAPEAAAAAAVNTQEQHRRLRDARMVERWLMTRARLEPSAAGRYCAALSEHGYTSLANISMGDLTRRSLVAEYGVLPGHAAPILRAIQGLPSPPPLPDQERLANQAQLSEQAAVGAAREQRHAARRAAGDSDSDTPSEESDEEGGGGGGDDDYRESGKDANNDEDGDGGGREDDGGSDWRNDSGGGGGDGDGGYAGGGDSRDDESSSSSSSRSRGGGGGMQGGGQALGGEGAPTDRSVHGSGHSNKGREDVQGSPVVEKKSLRQDVKGSSGHAVVGGGALRSSPQKAKKSSSLEAEQAECAALLTLFLAFQTTTSNNASSAAAGLSVLGGGWFSDHGWAQAALAAEEEARGRLTDSDAPGSSPRATVRTSPLPGRPFGKPSRATHVSGGNDDGDHDEASKPKGGRLVGFRGRLEAVALAPASKQLSVVEAVTALLLSASEAATPPLPRPPADVLYPTLLERLGSDSSSSSSSNSSDSSSIGAPLTKSGGAVGGRYRNTPAEAAAPSKRSVSAPLSWKVLLTGGGGNRVPLLTPSVPLARWHGVRCLDPEDLAKKNAQTRFKTQQQQQQQQQQQEPFSPASPLSPSLGMGLSSSSSSSRTAGFKVEEIALPKNNLRLRTIDQRTTESQKKQKKKGRRHDDNDDDEAEEEEAEAQPFPLALFRRLPRLKSLDLSCNALNCTLAQPQQLQGPSSYLSSSPPLSPSCNRNRNRNRNRDQHQFQSQSQSGGDDSSGTGTPTQVNQTSNTNAGSSSGSSSGRAPTVASPGLRLEPLLVSSASPQQPLGGGLLVPLSAPTFTAAYAAATAALSSPHLPTTTAATTAAAVLSARPGETRAQLLTRQQQQQQQQQRQPSSPLSPLDRCAQIPQKRVWPPRLVELRLFQCGLSGPLPPEMAELKKIRMLRLWGNSLTGRLPPALLRAWGPTLTDLDLSQNLLEGWLPNELGCGTCPHLKNLDLRSNGFDGPLPDALFSSAKSVSCPLESLFLSSNELVGPLPSALGDSLTRLEYLGLANNHLTGPLPQSLGNLQRLKSLALHSNQLSGVLPAALGHLSSLESLVVWENSLIGAAANLSLLKLTKQLQTVNLSNNPLENPEGLRAFFKRNLNPTCQVYI